MHNVTVYIPGLFHFIPEYSQQELLDLTAIRSLLNFGSIQSIAHHGFYQRIADLLGLQRQASGDVPYAALSRLRIEDARPEGVWMLVDPVHLKPTSNGLVLYDSRQFALSRHDTITLAATVSDLFDEFGYRLEVPEDEHWYLQLPSVPLLTTQDIFHVAGKDIASYLPEGEDESHWISLFNELQMRLFDCEVNRQRQARGELPINSLWFWGAGEIPGTLDRKWSRIYSNDDIIQCYCMVSSTESYSLSDYFVDTEQSITAQTLIVIPDILQAMQYDEPEGWLEAVKQTEHNWIAGLLRQVRNGRIKQLTVMTDRYQVILNASIALKFWKWQRSIHSFFER